MFRANCEQTVYLGGVLQVEFGGVTYTPDSDGKLALENTLHVTASYDGHNTTLDKTWKELKDAYTAGRFVLIEWPSDENYFWSSIWACGFNSGVYVIWENSGMEFTAATENDYPVALGG